MSLTCAYYFEVYKQYIVCVCMSLCFIDSVSLQVRYCGRQQGKQRMRQSQEALLSQEL